MPEVKIGVGANASSVDQAINKITQSMNKLGAAVAKNQGLKFEPAGVKDMARDLDLINKQFQKALALSAQLRNALKSSGQAGLHVSQIDWAKTSTSAATAKRLRDRAFNFAVQGTALDPTLANEVDEQGNPVAPAPQPSPAPTPHGGRKPRAAAPKPSIGRRVIGAFGRGVGGVGGGVVSEAAGASGGLGEMGVAAGGFLAAALAEKVGAAVVHFVGQGIDQAKDRNLGLDALKRQMGDLGISPDDLSGAAWSQGQGLGMANGDFVKLMANANAASGGAYRSPQELAEATRSGADLGRAYGVGTDQGVAFVSGMQRLNQRQDNKELAKQIAEAIVNAQGKATPGEVMQAMQGFAAAQNRFNSGAVDLNRFGNAYNDLMNADGMTADHASSILSQANSAMQQMGGTEASKNFTMQAFGTLDPVRAAMRAEGGLFGNGLDNKSIRSYMLAHGARNWDDLDGGPADTNFSVMRAAFDRAYAGRGQYGTEMELDAEKNYFGLKSYADTASFMNMSDSDHSALSGVLKNAGVGIGDVREGGLQTIAGFMKAGNFADLDNLYRGRNNSDLNDAEKAAINSAEGSGDRQTLLNELVRVFSGKGMEDTEATRQQNIDANIADMKTQIGEKLVPFTQMIMTGVLAFANKMPGIHLDNPWGDGGSNFVGPAASLKPLPPGSPAAPASQRAPGGSTVGGAGNARDMRGHVDTSGDAAKGWINNSAGVGTGFAFKYRDDVRAGMSQIMGMGVDKAHAAAIMASAIGESSMNPGARNGNMYGLFQLDKGRQDDFRKVMGKDIHGSTAAEQIDYMVRSMRAGGEEARPGKAFWASSAKDAARVFSDKIERPDNPGKNGDIRAGIASSLGDVNITLQQTIVGSNGQSKTRTLSTKVPKPAAQGTDVLGGNPVIVRLSS